MSLGLHDSKILTNQWLSKLMDWKAVVGPWSHCVQPASRAEQLAVVCAAALQSQNNGFFCACAYKVQFQYMSLGFPCLAATGAAGGPPPLCPPLEGGGWEQTVPREWLIQPATLSFVEEAAGCGPVNHSQVAHLASLLPSNLVKVHL